MSAKELGSPEVLAKIDKLRELNVGSMIPLPQLVVVGDQSSGKSSVLESLTGFSFPRATTLCTRYATQITSRRDPVQGVKVSIIPRPDADDDLKMRLLGFQREFYELDNHDLEELFRAANVAMGISEEHSEAFSQDILKIEINGPDEIHLTVIDVPGIFRVATPGITRETDPALVESMVKLYMQNRRTIILAVIPCNIDATTQEILKFASQADPHGNRTMGVLTKPDLVTEDATRETVMDLLQGRRSKLKLGYFVVKNRSADDDTSTSHQRTASETAFFTGHPWADAAGRCGVAALRERLRQLLMEISTREFPHLKSEVQSLLSRRRSDLDIMGSPRADEASQRLHLGKLATRFQTVTRAALGGTYASDDIFQRNPDLKLITKIMKLNENFSDTFWRRGHQHSFDPRCGDAEGDTRFYKDSSTGHLEIDHSKYDELDGIIEPENYKCPKPSAGSIMDMIQDVYESNRGPELGTYGGTMLWTVFEQQSKKWVPLALSHVSRIIALLHDFVFCLLDEICQETQIRDQLWEDLLAGRLVDVYQKAMDQTRLLLHFERGAMPSTLNHYFNSTLQRKRAERISNALECKKIDIKGCSYVRFEEIKVCSPDKSNGQHVCEDLLDSLAAYYKVSRKRFVDVLDQQVVSHLLLNGEGSALQIFGPELVMRLDYEQLRRIATEDEETQKRRQLLEREIERLEAALAVIRK